MRFGHRTHAAVRYLLLACLISLVCSFRLMAIDFPDVSAVFPLGAQQGSTYAAEILGQNLDKAYAVWFDCADLSARIKSVGPADPAPKDQKGEKGDGDTSKQRLLLEIVVSPQAKLGAHFLRVVTPRGISGPLAFRVGREPVILESRTSHNTPASAQNLNFPAIVDGTIGTPGEVDFYQLKVAKGQDLLFELVTSGGLYSGASGAFQTPHVALYEATGSWFDPNRLVELVPNDESKSLGPYLPRLTYHFETTTSVLVAVNAFQQPGGPDYGYQLRIAPNEPSRGLDKWTPRLLAHQAPNEFQERDFARELNVDWMGKISSRAAGPLPTGKVALVEEHPPNQTLAAAAGLKLPAMIDGVIDRPGDAEYFKFQVKEKQALVFEIETPRLCPPYFNPELTVLDENGQELVSNIYRRVGGAGVDWTKTLEPKTVYSFGHEGTYYIRINELANHAGSPDFRYRVLIRPAIPHLGSIGPKTFGNVGSESEVDHFNLVAGATEKLQVVCEREEGLDGDFAISVENLPPGVRAVAAATAPRDLPSSSGQTFEGRGAIHKESFRPQRMETTLLLVASANAPPTRLPRMLHLVVAPVIDGKLGSPQTVDEYPLMVIRPAEADVSKPKEKVNVAAK